MAIGFILTTPVFAQNSGSSVDDQSAEHAINISIPEVALVAVRGVSGTDISLAPPAPTEAGANFSDLADADSSLWLNYSHLRSSTSHPQRKIYARISNGQIPSGFRLRLAAGNGTGAQASSLGTPTGYVTLTSADNAIIENIQTTYTGKGVGTGHQLIYRLEVIPGQTDQIDFDSSSSVSVMYTISD
ncbi:MAG: hypothetical protein H6608_00155 [Flavobacteriales bacterium]|nr:hypothetical protein [Bacteroidota bacterium]MCB9239521.1 hypothetical protein [Flavobacteriales bacterium]